MSLYRHNDHTIFLFRFGLDIALLQILFYNENNVEENAFLTVSGIQKLYQTLITA